MTSINVSSTLTREAKAALQTNAYRNLVRANTAVAQATKTGGDVLIKAKAAVTQAAEKAKIVTDLAVAKPSKPNLTGKIATGIKGLWGTIKNHKKLSAGIAAVAVLGATWAVLANKNKQAESVDQAA